MLRRWKSLRCDTKYLSSHVLRSTSFFERTLLKFLKMTARGGYPKVSNSGEYAGWDKTTQLSPLIACLFMFTTHRLPGFFSTELPLWSWWFVQHPDLHWELDCFEGFHSKFVFANATKCRSFAFVNATRACLRMFSACRDSSTLFSASPEDTIFLPGNNKITEPFLVFTSAECVNVSNEGSSRVCLFR